MSEILSLEYLLLKLKYMMIAGLRHDERLQLLADQYSTKANGSYTCNICHKVFRDKYSIKMHLDSVHFTPEEGYSCDLCGKHCRTYAGLNCHKTNCQKL